MKESEVIIIDGIPKQEYDEISLSAFRYALISVGFTYNRMDKADICQRISNITKGKISENIFYYFCQKNNISVDHLRCTTPFWAPDQKDFIYLNGEWDIKNNFLYPTAGEALNYCDLPCLIPNKYHLDQWSRRDKLNFRSSIYGAYLFSFMEYGQGRKDFFTYTISDEQISFLLDISTRNKGNGFGGQPFLETWFWNTFDVLKMKSSFKLEYYPNSIITACANARYWQLFEDTGPELETTSTYLLEGNKAWFVNDKKVLKFLNGRLITKIKNRTCPVSLLPSFASLHPNLKEEMHFAHFKEV